MSKKTDNKHTALHRTRTKHYQPYYSFHDGKPMLDTGHKLHEHFTMGKDGEHMHFFDFESVDREWHKLRHTWDERKDARGKREQKERSEYDTKMKETKPAIKNASSSPTFPLGESYNPRMFSGQPRQRRKFMRGAFVIYEDTVWKVLSVNQNKYDLIHPVFAPRHNVDGIELTLSPAPEKKTPFRVGV